MQPLCVLLEQVFGGAILQQTVVVEFIVNGQMCDDCRRREAKDFWRAVVQVRQKVRMDACVDVHPKTAVACIYICMYPHTIVGRYLSTMCCVCCHFP